QGSRASQYAGQAGELLRRAAVTRARDPQRRGTAAVRGAREGVPLRREEQTMTAVSHFALARPYRLSLDSYAQVTGVHPELVRRLVAIGLLEVTRDAQGRLWFDPSQVREMARIQRLRMSLNLGYSAIGLVVELLDRIAELEKTQRRMSRRGGAPWT